jgi:3-hydroxyisobutyrate dehydrogenase-like beta-hydroxyacid dehydrogenase
VFVCGDKPGMGQTLKLANNIIAVAALAISSEAMAMGAKAGLDPQIMIDTIMASSGGNVALRDKFPKAVLTGTFDFGFATGLSYKDVRLCVDEAEAMGVPMVVGAAVRQLMAVTNATFGADSDFTSVARVLEGWAGVKIRSRH